MTPRMPPTVPAATAVLSRCEGGGESEGLAGADEMAATGVAGRAKIEEVVAGADETAATGVAV